MTDTPRYPTDLNPWALEPHYSRHVNAMTAERLDGKAAIAEQLAWRDQMIEQLRADLAAAHALHRDVARVYREEHERIAPLLALATLAAGQPAPDYSKDPRLSHALANPPGPRHAVLREALASARLDGETHCLPEESALSHACGILGAERCGCSLCTVNTCPACLALWRAPQGP